MKTQLDIFEIPFQENCQDFKTSKVKLGHLLGNDELNRQYKFIRLITKCVKCGKENTFDHFQIFTDKEMIAKGWSNIEPFVWQAMTKGCSRKCENFIK